MRTPRFLIRQVLLGTLTVLGVATLVFVAMRVAPGDPARVLLGDWADFASEEHVDLIRESMGLDKSLWHQYLLFLQSVATGELGISFRTGEAVREMIGRRFPFTLQLALVGFMVAGVIGIPTGIIAATHHSAWGDRLAMVGSMLGLVAPNFWVGLLLLYVLSFRLGWFPLFGAQQDKSGIAMAHALVLPAITVGSHSAALLARVTRSAMLEALSGNYVTTARAKGLAERSVVVKHALRNAALPVLTLLGINVAYLLGGSVIVEVVFARPGMGRLLVEAIFARDYPVVQGTVIVFAMLVVVANLITDTLYGILDPRLRGR
jgi:peptide/nickel transport system permease protein